MAASNRRSSTPHSRNTPQSFSQGTRLYAFSRSTKHVKTSLAYSQDVSKFCWRVKCGLYCYSWDENRTGYHSGLILQLFRGVFFKALGNRNVDYLKIPKKHLGPHKTLLRAVCLRPWFKLISRWRYVCLKCSRYICYHKCFFSKRHSDSSPLGMCCK